MIYFLSPTCFLKRLEFPSVYDTVKDELFELDETGFEFLMGCAGREGCDGGGCEEEFLVYALQEGILTIERGFTGRPPVKRAPEPSLRYLELQVTRRCNLRCGHCYLGPAKNIDLGPERIKDTFTEFEEMQGLRLLITGGEPLLHPNFWEINDLLKGRAFRRLLFTNGTMLTGDVAGRLNIDEIQVSLDGLEKGHELLRGRGTFRMAMEAIDIARNAGIDVSVATMVHPENVGDFDELEQLFKRLGIRDWIVDIPCAEGNLTENRIFQISPEAGGEYLRYGFGEGLHGGGEGFACGLHLASVSAEGKVARCAFYSEVPVGSIDEGLAVCWDRIEPLRIDDLVCDCEVKDLCRGGCRRRAEILGDKRGKDLYRCRAFDRGATLNIS
jgi:radical SAM protein with 4Fe4S-binding SPASM domain